MPCGAGRISSRLVAKGDRKFLRVCQVFFAIFYKKILHKNAEKCEGRKKKKTFDRLYIKGLEFRKDIKRKKEAGPV